MSISTARGRLTPEVTPLVDRATTVFYSCFTDIYRLSCTVSTLLATFVIAENGRKTISAARGCAKPEVMSPFDSLTSIWYRSEFFNYLFVQRYFSIIFYLSKVIRLLRFACKMPFENFGEVIFPREKIFFTDEIPKMHFLGACKSVQWSGL
jgi:hypothetical protein